MDGGSIQARGRSGGTVSLEYVSGKDLVITSWALEETSSHSLGDSLIAVRAGWMGKDCRQLYPGCSHGHSKPKLPAAQLHSGHEAGYESKEASESSSEFVSKSGELNTDSERQKGIPQLASTYHEGAVLELSDRRPDSRLHHLYRNPHSSQPQQIHDVTHQSFDSHVNSEDFHSAQSNPLLRQNSEVHKYDTLWYENHDDEIFNNHETMKNIHSQDSDSPKIHEQFQKFHRTQNRENLESISSVHSKTKYKKEPYNRYDRPQGSAGIEELLPSGSVSGMALQDRHVDRKEVKIMNQMKEIESEKKNKQRKEERPLQNRNPSRYEGQEDEIQLASYELADDYNLNRNSPWDDGGGGAASFLNEPAYSSYLLSQKPAVLEYADMPSPSKPSGRPESISRPNDNSQIAQPSMHPEKLLKYKYGIRRGLPAGNVGGEGLLESTENELYSPSLKYKQVTTVSNVSERSSLQSRISSTQAANMKDKGHQHLGIPTDAPTSFSTSTVNPVTKEEVAQFGLEDAVTDLFKNELIYQYIRDRHIRQTPSNYSITCC